jgi:hypothetical protein
MRLYCSRLCFCFLAVAALSLVLMPALALAADRAPNLQTRGDYNPNDATVELFQGVQDGQIGVKVIPKSEKQINVLIENKTDKPLNVKLPEAFAAVPVLAQIGNAGVGGNNNLNNSTNQGLGGGFGGGGFGGGGMGMFNVLPEKVGKIEVTTVCLEHDKSAPTARVPYELKPVEQFTDKPAVHELCKMFGAGRVPQRIAQAAAWNLNNGMSWQRLAAKQIRYANGATQPYFSPQEIMLAARVATAATRQAQQRASSDSLSQR